MSRQADELDAAERIRAAFQRALVVGFRGELVEGATDVEIDGWAAGQGVGVVPAAFREVMRILGRQGGAVYAGTVFGIRGPDAETKEMAVAGLALAGEHSIRDVANLLVISEAGGYSFLVIDGADLADADPAVWEVMESGRVMHCGSVSEGFERVVDDIVARKQRIVDDRAAGRAEDRWEAFRYRWD
ncbi:hypothetical protein AB0L82_17815 [Nocardia sp. NPDC052001]|uniref:hypothetical protein n=1 Tax=Nocardia sp. NPDC052001 TaxID=3154853 RepID=UPI00342D03C8